MMDKQVEAQGIVIVGEEICEQVISRTDAFKAVEAVFGAMAKGDAYNFPVVREAIGHADALYGFKGGFDKSGLTLGLKAGGYWPGNMEKGLTNHQSTVCLFDPDTGQLSALVGGNYLTALRTAASSSVSIAHLAREDSKVLGMVGAGHQSTFQLRAAAEQRDFDKVVAWNPHPDMLPRLQAVAEELGLAFEGVSKEEVDPVLFQRATVFADEIAQSVSIGEAQHAVAQGLIGESDITPLGAVINGTRAGRGSAEEITLFDGTGVGLQDLAVASVAARLARERGLVTPVSL